MPGIVTKSLELPADLNPEVVEFHCVNCGRFLGYVALVEGTVVMKCRRCKIWNVLDQHRVEVTEEVDKKVPIPLQSNKGRAKSQVSEDQRLPGSMDRGVIKTGEQP